MNYHYCVTYGRQCGIATFTENLDCKDYQITNTIPNEADEVILEFEYGLFNYIDFNKIKKLKVNGTKITTIMHSVKQSGLNTLIKDISDNIIVLNPLALNILKEAIYIPHPSENFHFNKEWAMENHIIHHGFLLPKNNTELIIKSNIDRNLHIFTSINNFSIFAYQIGIKLYHKIQDNLTDKINFDTNFYSKQELSKKMSLINGVILLPQDDEKDYHASGAVYMSLSTGNPVIVSKSTQFTDLDIPKINPNSQGIIDVLKNTEKYIKNYDFEGVKKMLDDRRPEKFIKKLRTL